MNVIPEIFHNLQHCFECYSNHNKMKTYLVTGGAGFIGSNFVHYIINKYGTDDLCIVILDLLTYAGNLNNIKDKLQLPNIEFIKGDINNAELVSSIFANRDIDYVVNFAAESHVDRSIVNPRLFLETNILGTQTLLDVARHAWFEGMDKNGKPTYKKGKKFLQISTDEVYGSLENEYAQPQPLHLDEHLKKVVGSRTDLKTFGKSFFTESTPLSPRSPYSASKASADMLVMAYNETYCLPVNITRCSNNYGAYQFPEKLIPLMINNVLEGKRLPVYGTGMNVRDWLYVEDHCKAIDEVLEKGNNGDVYNIGGFNEECNINIVKLIISTISKIMHEEPEYRHLLKCKLDDINESFIDYVTDRPGHDMRYAINPTKIATTLGWYPETTFKTGIVKTIRWYLDNREWVADVTSGDYQKYYAEMYDNR